MIKRMRFYRFWDQTRKFGLGAPDPENVEIVEVFLFAYIQLTNTLQLSPQPLS